MTQFPRAGTLPVLFPRAGTLPVLFPRAGTLQAGIPRARSARACFPAARRPVRAGVPGVVLPAGFPGGGFLGFPGQPPELYRKIAEPARCRLRSMGCLL